MSEDSRTTRLLIEIRDEIRHTNTRLDQTNVRLDQTNAQLDRTALRLENAIERVREDMEGKFVDLDLRQSSRIMQQTAVLLDLKEAFSDRRELRDRIAHCEREIEELKKGTA